MKAKTFKPKKLTVNTGVEAKEPTAREKEILIAAQKHCGKTVFNKKGHVRQDTKEDMRLFWAGAQWADRHQPVIIKAIWMAIGAITAMTGIALGIIVAL